mgnify:CR=1 FL=1
MTGIITIKCEDCKKNYIPIKQKFCEECIERQIKEEE